MFLFDCSSNEIHTIIKEFENDKASDISISVLIKCAPFISEHLSQFLNSFMRLGIFPQKLKVGKVSPIFKKGDVQLFDNYRQFRFCQFLARYLKRYYNRLYSFLTSEGMMYKKQFGFRKHHSTAHAINYSINQIINELQQKTMLLVYLLILAKLSIPLITTNYLLNLSTMALEVPAINCLLITC